jgi:two-component system response regulator YesN
VHGVSNDVAQVRRKSLRVLITDDSEPVRSALSDLIARLDDVEIVGLAANGTEGFELARRLKPDAMTLDIRMPGMNGIKVLEAIKQEGLQLTVIVLTGLDDEQYRKRCLNLGASHFFNKAAEFEQVMSVLAQKAATLNMAAEPSAVQV